jgi:hypothetical protein
MNPPDVHIDRLALRVSGLDADAARALTRLVAQKLAAGLTPAAGTPGAAAPGGAAEDSSLDALARRIADQVARACEVTP